MTARSQPGPTTKATDAELNAAHQAGLHGVSWARHAQAGGGAEVDFDGRPTEHGRLLKDAWRAGDAERRRQARADTVARARTGARKAAAIAGRAPAPGRRDLRAAAATVEGTGSWLGLAVAAFGLVLLYVLLTTGVASKVFAGVSSWLVRFMSPNYPLF